MNEDGEVINILLVDDCDNDIAIVQDAFEEARLMNILDVVKDGEEALAYLRKQGKYSNKSTPGLILLDINMPKKNGFEVLEELKADNNLKHLPVIMLTTSKRDEDVAQSYSKGACSYVTKPVKFKELQDIVEQFAMYWAVVSRIPPRGD